MMGDDMPSHTLDPTLTRRTFLTAGGATIVYLAGCRSGLASSNGGPRADGRVFTGPWLAITGDNDVVVLVDKCEMGQGVRHMFASIVAEELGLKPEAVVVEEARVEPARYGNRHVVPEIHGIELGQFSLFQFQMTGGSSSVIDMCDEDKLWDTAARTRHLLKTRAAQHLRKREDEIELKDGMARAGEDTKRFAELVGDGKTGRTKVPKSSLDILGRTDAPRERIDARGKVTGRARFGFDISPKDLEPDGIFVPSLPVALVLRPSRTRDSLEVSEQNWNDVTKTAGVRRLVQLRKGRGVAVVADSFWHADRARRALRPKEVAADGPRADSDVILRSYERALEERAAALGNAATSPDPEPPWRTYVTPFGPHAAMEPLSAVCAKDPKGAYHIYAATQFPQSARAQAARALGEPKSRVLIHGLLAGGAFGRRAASDFIVEVAEICKELEGAAVKLVWTREDDFRHDYMRPCAVSRVRGATKNAKDTTITKWDHLLITESPHFGLGKEYLAALGLDGVLGWVPPGWLPKWRSYKKRHTGIVDPTIEEGLTNSVYEMRPAKHVLPIPKTQPPLQNTVRVGYWRSVACFHNIFAVESRLDELAWDMRSDPLTIRRANLQRDGLDSEAQKQQARMLWCVEKVATLAGARKLQDRGTGYGIACFSGWGSFAALVVRVEQDAQDPREIRVRDAWAAVDCGFVLNPDVLHQQVEGGIIFGLSAALKQEITTVNGVVRETNFHACDSLRINECPTITVDHQDKHKPRNEPSTGVGELMVPLPAPAVANAVFNLTGRRFRRIPLGRGDDR